MQNLTQDGQQLVNNLSAKYNLSFDAVMHMLIAVNNGAGSMAQFNCPELGGSGQWMRGGMTMVSDLFNYSLKMTVDNLCNELANGLANLQIFVPIPKGAPGSREWWPGDLGSPFSSGAQNNIRYAVFPNRLAVEVNGQVTVYDTLDNNIGGVSQQQGGDLNLTFSSQYGTIPINSLPIISGSGLAPAPQSNFAQPTQHSHDHAHDMGTENTSPNVVTPVSNSISAANAQSAHSKNGLANTSSLDDIIQLIEKLAKLRDAGAITDEDYNGKKAELLSRI